MAKHTVTIKNMAYQPTPLSIAKGDEVVWDNQDKMIHTATFTFDTTGTIKGGGVSGPIRFPESGTFDYTCDFHDMSGRVVVK
jgi:plastocyanin